MGQYIDKSAVVAKIRERLLPVIRDKHYDEWEEGQDSERIAILDIIDTLEVKEVDLEKEFDDYIEKQNAFTNNDNSEIKYYNGDSFNHVYDIYPIAQYFFELGLKAQKGE